MYKIIYSLCFANRNRRRKALNIALWILRVLCNIEFDIMNRSLSTPSNYCCNTCAEEDFAASEHALGFIDCAINDLEYTY